ncbi:hypothetical protein CEV34_1667 [Brucella pseudogrignonensis]|uniref:Uncharacterized protein n=1 Tax=Brucella pseudogrignonensis TaxID=419475 RepID=A0A256GL13_9HYPH|nr:hypothetical protein CEV34_1667 [Brucella pseudogrignonensis]
MCYERAQQARISDERAHISMQQIVFTGALYAAPSTVENICPFRST